MDSILNILFILTDQQRWDTCGVHGNPLDLTPNFDRMARQGTHLSQMFTCQPVCSPARACLQTGMYATQAGVWRNGLPLSKNARTLAQCFADAGYDTGYIGKWHLADTGDGPVPVDQRGGYDYWLASNALEMTSEAYRVTMYDQQNQPVRLPGYRVDALTDAAIRYIDNHQERPFFLFLSYMEPHFQNRLDNYPAPEGYEERYNGGWMPPDLAALGGSAHEHLPGYYGMVKRLDEALGRLLEALKSLDLIGNTLVVFTSDHGNHFKTRNDEYKRSCHDASIRVPGAIQGTGFNGGGCVCELVSLIDLPSSLLDATGILIPPQMQGHSIMPLIRHEKVDWQKEIFVQISESQVGRAIRTKRWKYSVVAKDKDGVNDPGSDRYAEECLYDLEADPHELRNLIGLESHLEVTDAMRKRLIQRMVEAGEAAPVIEAAPTRPRNPQHYIRPDEIY